MPFDYYIADVFTDVLFGGNQLAGGLHPHLERPDACPRKALNRPPLAPRKAAHYEPSMVDNRTLRAQASPA